MIVISFYLVSEDYVRDPEWAVGSSDVLSARALVESNRFLINAPAEERGVAPWRVTSVRWLPLRT